MAHISTAWACSGFITVMMLAQTAAQSQISTQSDISNIANNLKLIVYVETNHLSTGTYDIIFHLMNVGNRKILHTADWEILFNMHNTDLLTRRVFEVHGFRLTEVRDTLYKMHATPAFPGLNPGEGFKITVQAKGLSVFKQDMYPRYIVKSVGTNPEVIASTNDDDLKFVQLLVKGDPADDFSIMTPVQRSMMTPDVEDTGRVPGSIVIPAPKNITVNQGVELLNLSTINVFHVWADQRLKNSGYLNKFRDTITAIPEIPVGKLKFANAEPPATVDKIFLRLTAPAAGKTDDYYKLAVRPRVTGLRDFSLIHMEAVTEKGLHNAVESLVSVVGLYDTLPTMTIIDDARFGHRSLSLDLTKHFIPRETLLKVLKLMGMYKLNKLELNLGDDYNWRLAIDDIPTLSAFAAKRCLGDCMPPFFGSGPISQMPGSGSFSIPQFAEIIERAAAMHIEVIPKFNFLGGLLSAKKATQKYYEMNLGKNNVLANKAKRFNLVSDPPVVANTPEDFFTSEGLLDPCIPQTYTFINTVIDRVSNAYKRAKVTLKSLHAGGDELTQYLGSFPSCKSKLDISSNADAVRNMISSIQGKLASINPDAVLHVNEEAIIDQNECLTIPIGSKMDQSHLVAHFYKTFPGNPDDMQLTAAQMAYLEADVAEYLPNDTNPVQDPLIPYTGQKKSSAPWILPYRCANNGYKIVLKPENFFALDQAYELDFEEPGNRKMRRFHIINMHRMMMYEPLNHYINMDIGKDGWTYLQYRLCKIHSCDTLTKPENVIGLTATLDTSVIRSEKMLFHMLLPRLLCFAERAWRQGEHENILKAEVPTTLTNDVNLDRRSGLITMEITRLLNNIAYKDGGRLDESGFPFRVPTIGASITLGLAFRRLPPYPLVFKTDMPGFEVQIKDLNSPQLGWRPVFKFDAAQQRVVGGYTFSFPDSNQRVELRVVSPGGRDTSVKPPRPGRSIIMTGSKENYLPRMIPVELLEGTCISPENLTDVQNATSIQLRRAIQNIPVVYDEGREFEYNRMGLLNSIVTNYHSNASAPRVGNLENVFAMIQAEFDKGVNVSRLPSTNILRIVHERNMQNFDQRGAFVETRFRNWHQQSLRCKAGLAEPSLLANPRFEGGGPGGGAGMNRQDQMDPRAQSAGGVPPRGAGAGAGGRGQMRGMSGTSSQRRAQDLDQGRGSIRRDQARGRRV